MSEFVVAGSGTSARPAQARLDSHYIGELLGELTSNSIRLRHQARERLAKMGEAAVPYLIQAMNSRDEQLRWEAAKTLDEIASPSTVQALMGALEDENCDIRWLASEGLVALGDKALVPLLEALEHRSNSAWFREGAHRVLFKLARGDLAGALLPVLVAMEDVEPAVEVPPAAYAALVALRRQGTAVLS